MINIERYFTNIEGYFTTLGVQGSDTVGQINIRWKYWTQGFAEAQNWELFSKITASLLEFSIHHFVVAHSDYFLWVDQWSSVWMTILCLIKAKSLRIIEVAHNHALLIEVLRFWHVEENPINCPLHTLDLSQTGIKQACTVQSIDEQSCHRMHVSLSCCMLLDRTQNRSRRMQVQSSSEHCAWSTDLSVCSIWYNATSYLPDSKGRMAHQELVTSSQTWHWVMLGTSELS